MEVDVWPQDGLVMVVVVETQPELKPDRELVVARLSSYPQQAGHLSLRPRV